MMDGTGLNSAWRTSIASVALMAFFAGCAAGPVWSEATAVDLGDVAAVSAPIGQPVIAAASGDKETARGGIVVGVGQLHFTGFETRATRDAERIDAAMPANTHLFYSDLYDTGFGVAVSWIAHGPQTGAPSIGDSYFMVTGDYETFTGKTGSLPGNVTVDIDALTILAVWSDVKTMLNSPGSRSVFKPYVRYGVGLGTNSAVNLNGEEFYSEGLVAGLRGGLGIEVHVIGLQIFLDMGPQVISAPTQAGDAGVGMAEPMFTAPMNFGLVLSF
jgi:hypothetical protein